MERRIHGEPAVRKAREANAPIAWLGADAGAAAGIGGVWLEKLCRDAAVRLDMLAAENTGPKAYKLLARQSGLDDTLLNEEWLHGVTGLGHAAFFYLVARLEDWTAGDPEAALSRNGGGGQDGAPASRSLACDNMLCMTVCRMRVGCAHEALLGVFKVDRAAAPRITGMVRGMLASAGVLPTDRAIAAGLSALPRTEAGAAVGGAALHGGTSMQAEGQSDRAFGSGSSPGRAERQPAGAIVRDISF